MQEMLAGLIEDVHIELLLEGNISAEEACELAHGLSQELPGMRLPISMRLQEQVALIPKGHSIILR